MSRARRFALGGVVTAGGVVLLVLYLRSGDGAASKPAEPQPPVTDRASDPINARRPPRGATPQAQELDVTVAAEAYAKALAAKVDDPGAVAFRATTDAYFDYNLELAKEQAAKEGLTLAQLKELTYFGMVVLRARQWGDVEAALGHELTQDEETAGDALVDGTNQEFKQQMRDAVAAGADDAAKDALIAATEKQFFDEYYALTGLTPAQFDDLLAGDVTGTKKYAPAGTNPDPSALPPQSIKPPQPGQPGGR